MSGIEMTAIGKETRRAPRPPSPRGQMENTQGLNILCPKNSPGKNIAVASHSLLQGSNPGIESGSPTLQAFFNI